MEYILQEIFARLTIYNFCERIITTIAIQQKNRKYTYQTNFTVAVFICREYFRDRIHPSDLVALIRKNILPIREGRKAPRKVRPNSSKQLLEYSNAIVHAFQGFRAPFSGKIVHIFPEQSAAFN